MHIPAIINAHNMYIETSAVERVFQLLYICGSWNEEMSAAPIYPAIWGGSNPTRNGGTDVVIYMYGPVICSVIFNLVQIIVLQYVSYVVSTARLFRPHHHSYHCLPFVLWFDNPLPFQLWEQNTQTILWYFY